MRRGRRIEVREFKYEAKWARLHWKQVLECFEIIMRYSHKHVKQCASSGTFNRTVFICLSTCLISYMAEYCTTCIFHIKQCNEWWKSELKSLKSLRGYTVLRSLAFVNWILKLNVHGEIDYSKRIACHMKNTGMLTLEKLLSQCY